MICKLQSSQRVYRIFSLTFLLFKVIGLATFSVNTGSKKKCSEIQFSFTVTKLGVLYNFLLSCLMIISNFIVIPYKYQYEYANKTVITTIIEVSQGILGSLMVCSILLCYCANQSFIVKAGNRLIRIEAELRRLRQPINWTRIVCVLFVVCSLHLGLSVVVLTTDYFAFQLNPVMWFGDIVPTVFSGWLFVQYSSMVTIMDAFFASVNRMIQDLCRKWHDYDCPETLYRSRRMFINNSTARSILQLRIVHDHLCDVAKDVSKFYSLPVLISLPFIFFTLLYNVYYILEPLVVEVKILKPMILTNTVFWIFLLLYPLGLLTARITRIVDEIGKTGTFVNSLLNYVVDREAKAELEQFSLQLLHRKIKFTASGYFDLDNTLLQSIFATVTSYLVILIQFQMSTSSSDAYYCNYTDVPKSND